jgi:hypothetical protein
VTANFFSASARRVIQRWPLARPGIDLRPVVIDAAERAADRRVEGRRELEAQPIRFDAA